jgi:hypothetical protein
MEASSTFRISAATLNELLSTRIDHKLRSSMVLRHFLDESIFSPETSAADVQLLACQLECWYPPQAAGPHVLQAYTGRLAPL